jgi:hypothetical protein
MWDPRAELRSRHLDDLVGRLAEGSPRYRERLAGEVRVLPAGAIPRVELGKAERVVQRTVEDNPLPGWL